MWLISANRPLQPLAIRRLRWRVSKTQPQIKTVKRGRGARGRFAFSSAMTQGHPLNISHLNLPRMLGERDISSRCPGRIMRLVLSKTFHLPTCRKGLSDLGRQESGLAMGGHTTGDQDGNHGEARGAIERSQPFRRKGPTARASGLCLRCLSSAI